MADDDLSNLDCAFPLLTIPADGISEHHQGTVTNRIVNDRLTVVETYYDLVGNVKEAFAKYRKGNEHA